MPGGRVLPNAGLRAFFDLGEDYWDQDDADNDYMSTNLLKLSVLVQGRVLSIESATPGAPTDGDVYIFDDTHPTNANAIAIYDVDTWKYITPLEGWMMYNETQGSFVRFNGSTWSGFVGDGSPVLTEAADYTVSPDDQGRYIRLTNALAKTVTVDPEATTALPDNGEWHFRNAGAGDATFAPGSGVAINAPNGGTLVVPENGTVTLKRVVADEFDLLGQTVSA